MRKKPFNFINKLSADKIELTAEYLKDESKHLLGLVIYFLNKEATDIFFSKLDEDIIGDIMVVISHINMVNYDIIKDVENYIKRFLIKVPKGYKFKREENIVKVKELVITLPNDKIKQTLKIIKDDDRDLFTDIVQEVSRTNPEKLI